jgi:hypothetical protein
LVTHFRIWIGAALACGALTLWGCSGMSLDRSGSGGGGASAGGTPSSGGAGGAGGAAGEGGTSGTGGAAGEGGTPGTGGAAGEGGTAAAGGAGSGGRPGTGGCNSISFPGPVLNVFDAQTGTPICDPTFTIVAQTDGGSMFDDALASSCTPSSYNCSVSYDGGATLCPFYLAGLGYSMDATVDVWAPGYQHTAVPGVSVGRSGCVPPFFPSSHLNVNLSRLPADAGAAGDASLSSTYAARK